MVNRVIHIFLGVHQLYFLAFGDTGAPNCENLKAYYFPKIADAEANIETGNAIITLSGSIRVRTPTPSHSLL